MLYHSPTHQVSFSVKRIARSIANKACTLDATYEKRGHFESSWPPSLTTSYAIMVRCKLQLYDIGS